MVRRAAGGLLFFVALPVAGYGLLYIGAIWTSDSSTGTLIMVGGLLMAVAAAQIAGAVVLLLRSPSTRGRRPLT